MCPHFYPPIFPLAGTRWERDTQINSWVIQSLWSPRAQYLLHPHPSIPLLGTPAAQACNIFINLLSSPVPPCPKLVPEGPCSTPTLRLHSPLTQHVSLGLSLLRRSLLNSRGLVPFPLGALAPRQFFPRSIKAEARDCGKKPEPSEEQRLPSASAPYSARLSPAAPANSPLPPSLGMWPSPCAQLSSLHSQAGLARPPCVPQMPVPRPGRTSAGLQGSALQWAGRMAAGREGGRGDLAASARSGPGRGSQPARQCEERGQALRVVHPAPALREPVPGAAVPEVSSVPPVSGLCSLGQLCQAGHSWGVWGRAAWAGGLGTVGFLSRGRRIHRDHLGHRTSSGHKLGALAVGGRVGQELGV